MVNSVLAEITSDAAVQRSAMIPSLSTGTLNSTHTIGVARIYDVVLMV